MSDLLGDQSEASLGDVHYLRVWVESREGGKPIIILGYRTVEVARTFGLLDKITHLAYSARFLVV